MREVLIMLEDTVAGHGVETGEELWSFEWPGSSTTDGSASQVVAVDGERVFVSKAYGVGPYRVHRSSDEWQAERIWHEPTHMRTKFTNVAIHKGYVYGLSDGILECVALESGKRMWKKGACGQGQVLRVDARC